MFFKRKKQQTLEPASKEQGYWSVVRKHFYKSKSAVWSIRILMALIFVALFSDFIANEKPLYCKLDGTTYYPVCKDYLVSLGWDRWDAQFFSIDWKEANYEAVVWAPITYSAYTIDYKNTQFKSPFDAQRVSSRRHWHWLGTDEIGRDVAAGMVSGTRTAMLVGVIAMSIATIIGVFFGAIAGYFGDDRLRASRLQIGCNLLGLVLGAFYGFMVRSFALSDGGNSFLEMLKSMLIFLGILALANLLAFALERLSGWNKKRALPVDLMVMRFIEVLNSIPGLLLVLAILALIKRPTIFDIMVIIGFIAWTGIARFLRGELLRVRELEYIQAAQAMGFNEWRIIWRHALPNAIGPVLVSVAFGIASAILMEAALNFLGLGLSIDQITWGSLLNEARRDFSAWWIALVPGFAIFITVTIFNLIGDALGSAIDPRLNQ